MSNAALTDEQRQQLLESYLRARPQTDQRVPRRGSKRAAGTVLPLTVAQKQLWLHAQLAPGTALYNEPLTLRRTGPLDVVALEQSFTEIVRRHEAWRTVFPAIEGEPMQVVEVPFEVGLPVVDLRSLPESEGERIAQRLATEDAQKPFDLAMGPLFRAKLACLGAQDYRLYIVLHHLIFDGFSGYRVFLPELAALYDAFSHGKPSPLRELDFQFADYALWQREAEQEQEIQNSIAYWNGQLTGAPAALNLPVANKRPAGQSFSGGMHSLELPAALSENLKRLSRDASATLYMTLLTAFNVLLYRYSGQEDIVIGSNSAGRNFPGTDKLLGYFLNTIVLRSDLSGNPSFVELLDRVKQVTLGALAHDAAPLDRMIASLHPVRDPNRNPLFQVLFSLEPPVAAKIPGWDLTCIDVETGTSKFELCLVLDDRPDGLLCRFIYSTALFDEPTIVRMAEHWRKLLESIVASPSARVGELSLITEGEQRQLLVDWNQNTGPKPQTCVHELFATQAKKTPDAVAVQCGTDRLSYSGLDEGSERLARVLRSMNVGPNQPVAISVERSVDMMVGILGILKAGGAYVPLDPAYPRERLEFMLADCGANVLVTEERLGLAKLSRTVQEVFLDSDFEGGEKTDRVAPETGRVTFNDLAYIIYTSGSTGAPKGVEVTHGNLAHSNQGRLQFYREPVGRFLLLSSYAFDSSIAGIFHTLTSGGTLVIPPAVARIEPETLSRLISDHSITHVLTFPSLYAELLEHADLARLASLRTVIVAGEACAREVVNRHYRALPQTSLFNEYGPTEATVWTHVHECEPGEQDAPVPIGHPIVNTRCYVLDVNRQPVPIRVPGELYIGGEGVTRGYRNRPDLTAASFVVDPFSKDSAARLYRTGDLVRYLPDGNLEFLGRRDQQVKIHGLRIELGEIEATLSQHPDVREAAVVSQPTSSGDPELHAYVAAREEFHTSSGELKHFLQRRLPAHMIPTSFHFLAALPRTPNGKVEKARLLAVETGAGVEAPTATIGPRNDRERRLLTIWRHVFKRDIKDVTEDFFVLGGHSLLAAELLAGIEKEFGTALSLAFVFQSPTVEKMAEALHSAGQSLHERAIIPIQPDGKQPPLFWVRGGPRFRLLAEKLGPNQPFLGLDLPHWDGSQLPVPYRFEDIATLLVRAMQQVQPHGPYHLGGLCVNAVLAYEIARQLRVQGEDVALLALLDGHNQAYYKNPLTDGRYTGRIKYHLTNLLQLETREKQGYLLDRMDEARRKINRLVWQLTSDRKDGAIRNTDNIVHPAFHRYDPDPYLGKMVLMQSSDWPSGPYFDFKLGWEHLVEGGIEFHWIPGDHPSMFTEPNVNVVADKLRTHLCADTLQGRRQ